MLLDGSFGANESSDFPYGASYAEYVDAFASGYPESQEVIAARHTGAGTGDWVDIPSSHIPYRYGYALVSFSNPSESAFQFRVEGENVSTEGQIALYDARVVVESGGSLTYYDVAADGGANYISGITPNDTLTLVVGAWSRDWSPGASEQLHSRYAIVASDWEDPGGEPSGEPSSEPSDEGGGTGQRRQ